MVKKIVHTDLTGNVMVESIDLKQTDQIHIDDYVSRGFLDAVVIDSDTLPIDTEYGQAWSLSDSTISVDMSIAKTIHRNKIRTERTQHFVETDALIMEAWSQRKDTTEIENRKEYLRNITDNSSIESAKNTSGLKLVSILPWSPPVIKDALICDYKRTEINLPTYTLTGNDYCVGVVHTLTAPVTLTLPEISSVGQKRYVIKDEGGNASLNIITLDISGSDTIDGLSSTIINTNYGVLALYNNGSTGWFIASNN